jgi:hypothetical protein
MQHLNWTWRNRLPRMIKNYTPKGRRNQERSLKRLLDAWDRNGSTSGPTPWFLHDDDDEVYFKHNESMHSFILIYSNFIWIFFFVNNLKHLNLTANRVTIVTGPI